MDPCNLKGFKWLLTLMTTWTGFVSATEKQLVTSNTPETATGPEQYDPVVFTVSYVKKIS